MVAKEPDGVKAEDFESFFRRDFPRLVLHLSIRGFEEHAVDAAQEAMNAAYEKWPTIVSPGAWVRTVAVRCALRERTRALERVLSDDAYGRRNQPAAPWDPAVLAELAEQQGVVLQQLKAMPPVRRAVVALAFDAYTVKEIAAELGIAEATVRSHVRHARRALQSPMTETGGAA